MTNEIRAVFEQAGCEGTLCVQSLDDDAELGLCADEPVVPASVVKVQIALEAETWFAGGRLDPREPVTLSAAGRTPGPAGISLFDDDAVVSWRGPAGPVLPPPGNPPAPRPPPPAGGRPGAPTAAPPRAPRA